jgi:predicted phage terminase large subunit-like protein
MSAAPISPADQLRSLSLEERRQRIADLEPVEAERLLFDWQFWARASQLSPPGPWRCWLLLTGRGFGKTRALSELARQWARDNEYVNLVAPTVDDCRDILVEGESGILNCCPASERPAYIVSKRLLAWPNGAKSLLFTSDEPDRLRGKQHSKLIADEIAAWRYPDDAWAQAMMGLRLGADPQVACATTPRPIRLVKELMQSPQTVVTRGTSFDNAQNLAPAFLAEIVSRYQGTRLGRQELMAELLSDNPNALWKRDVIDSLRVPSAPALRRVVVGVDPAVTANEDSDLIGIVVAGRSADGHIYVLDDLSLKASPDGWAERVILAYRKHRADRVIGETNNGGDLIEAVLRSKDASISYKSVHASRGKIVRAEPIAALYEQGRVHHVGSFAPLEDELCDYAPATSTKSPDRLDALVWALSELSDSVVFSTLPVMEYLKQEYVRQTNSDINPYTGAKIELAKPPTPEGPGAEGPGAKCFFCGSADIRSGDGWLRCADCRAAWVPQPEQVVLQ